MMSNRNPRIEHECKAAYLMDVNITPVWSPRLEAYCEANNITLQDAICDILHAFLHPETYPFPES